MNTFVKRDNNGKVRVVIVELIALASGYFVIRGSSGLLDGKKVDRPEVIIKEGKAKRTIEEQAKLQYNSICSDYLDKGYKQIESLGIDPSSDPLTWEASIPTNNTDSKGAVKPMLAKSLEGADSKWEKAWRGKEWLCSRKLDGTRCLMYFDGMQVRTTSRGGKDYDVAANHIITHPDVVSYFKDNPTVILDGELYIHGKPLSYISGLTRLKAISPEHKELQYWVYDVVQETTLFSARLAFLKTASHILPHDYIRIVEHVPLIGLNNIRKQHDKWVEEGFEGLVMRDPTMPYKCGARDWRMCKMKIFQDDEFKILDLVDGLRDEDMCFLMETKEGYTFKAKPIGDRTLKQWYRDNIDTIKNKMGTVKFFGYTTTEQPVPNLPVFKSLRDYSDL